MRYTGVTARGILTPIFQQGDDLIGEIVKCLVNASEAEGFNLNNRDIVAVTEAVVGRTQGNYATCEQVAKAFSQTFESDEIGLVFPILSRNRFAILLKSFAMGAKRIFLQLSYPSDEVGNTFISIDDADEKGVNIFTDSFSEQEFRSIFGTNTKHTFTGVDYIEYYKSINENIEIVFSNDPKYILNFTNDVLVCDVHTRFRTQKILRSAGANVYRLDEIMNESIDGSGYNPLYGVLGSNKASEERLKLFPIETDKFVVDLQQAILAKTGKLMECMVYGDGGFKDPVGGIWELADPVISPSFTSGLIGTPNELKIKYVADEEFAHLSGEELSCALKQKIKLKSVSQPEQIFSDGTTPRRYSDLVGSLSDLVSGSGDRGTPVVLVQNYFSDYALS
ncbi:MAG: coenzyme F420-0:L-glutamate ligase [Oscillospiraceae bacterium]|nr:coenzyme F420-0:L-glutamate ligase [Oscillospiraceae bacterium]